MGEPPDLRNPHGQLFRAVFKMPEVATELGCCATAHPRLHT